MARTCFLVNEIRTGETHIEDYEDDPEMLQGCLKRLNGGSTFETRYFIFAGPFTPDTARKRLNEIKRMTRQESEASAR